MSKIFEMSFHICSIRFSTRISGNFWSNESCPRTTVIKRRCTALPSICASSNFAWSSRNCMTSLLVSMWRSLLPGDSKRIDRDENRGQGTILLHEILARFWGSYISRHLNFAIFRKFCVYILCNIITYLKYFCSWAIVIWSKMRPNSSDKHFELAHF